jgi:hypothetical protein
VRSRLSGAQRPEFGLQLCHGTIALAVMHMNGMGVKSLRMGLGNLYPLAEGQSLGTATPPTCRQAKKEKAQINGKLRVIEST